MTVAAINNRALQATRAAESRSNLGLDPVLLSAFAAIICIGIVMVFSSTIAMGGERLETNFDHLLRHMIYLSIGLSTAVFLAATPVWFWQKVSVPLLGLSLLLLMTVLFVGAEINGSQRWLVISGFRLQPAEAAKLAMVMYAASYLARRQQELAKFSHGIINIGIVIAVLGVLLLLQPDFGSFFVITLTVGMMMFLGGIRISHLVVSRSRWGGDVCSGDNESLSNDAHS